MRISLAFLCDAANVTSDNKLNVLGMFSEIRSKRFPVTFPSLALVLRLDSGPQEDGARSLSVRLIDGDGGEVMPELEIPFLLTEDGDGALCVNTLAMVTFPRADDYGFEISVDERSLATVPLKVAKEGPEKGK